MRTLFTLLVVAVATMAAGCELLGFSDSETDLAYEFETERTRYSVGDSLKATFVNESSRTLYVREQGCTIAGIEQRIDANWREVVIPIGCTGLVSGPFPLRAGEKWPVGLAAWMLEEAGVQPGTYRLTFFVSESREGKPEKATSNQFSIVAQ